MASFDFGLLDEANAEDCSMWNEVVNGVDSYRGRVSFASDLKVGNEKEMVMAETKSNAGTLPLRKPLGSLGTNQQQQLQSPVSHKSPRAALPDVERPPSNSNKVKQVRSHGETQKVVDLSPHPRQNKKLLESEFYENTPLDSSLTHHLFEASHAQAMIPQQTRGATVGPVLFEDYSSLLSPLSASKPSPGASTAQAPSSRPSSRRRHTDLPRQYNSNEPSVLERCTTFSAEDQQQQYFTFSRADSMGLDSVVSASKSPDQRITSPPTDPSPLGYHANVSKMCCDDKHAKETSFSDPSATRSLPDTSASHSKIEAQAKHRNQQSHSLLSTPKLIVSDNSVDLLASISGIASDNAQIDNTEGHRQNLSSHSNANDADANEYETLQHRDMIEDYISEPLSVRGDKEKIGESGTEYNPQTTGYLPEPQSGHQQQPSTSRSMRSFSQGSVYNKNSGSCATDTERLSVSKNRDKLAATQESIRRTPSPRESLRVLGDMPQVESSVATAQSTAGHTGRVAAMVAAVTVAENRGRHSAMSCDVSAALRSTHESLTCHSPVLDWKSRGSTPSRRASVAQLVRSVIRSSPLTRPVASLDNARLLSSSSQSKLGCSPVRTPSSGGGTRQGQNPKSRGESHAPIDAASGTTKSLHSTLSSRSVDPGGLSDGDFVTHRLARTAQASANSLQASSVHSDVACERNLCISNSLGEENVPSSSNFVQMETICNLPVHGEQGNGESFLWGGSYPLCEEARHRNDTNGFGTYFEGRGDSSSVSAPASAIDHHSTQDSGTLSQRSTSNSRSCSQNRSQTITETIAADSKQFNEIADSNAVPFVRFEVPLRSNDETAALTNPSVISELATEAKVRPPSPFECMDRNIIKKDDAENAEILKDEAKICEPSRSCDNDVTSYAVESKPDLRLQKSTLKNTGTMEREKVDFGGMHNDDDDEATLRFACCAGQSTATMLQLTNNATQEMVVFARFRHTSTRHKEYSKSFEVEPSVPTVLSPGTALTLTVSFHAPDRYKSTREDISDSTFHTQLVICRRIVSLPEIKSTLRIVAATLIPPTLHLNAESLVWTPPTNISKCGEEDSWTIAQMSVKHENNLIKETWLERRQTVKVWNNGEVLCRVEGEILGGGSFVEGNAAFMFSLEASVDARGGQQRPQQRVSLEVFPGEYTNICISCRVKGDDDSGSGTVVPCPYDKQLAILLLRATAIQDDCLGKQRGNSISISPNNGTMERMPFIATDDSGCDCKAYTIPLRLASISISKNSENVGDCPRNVLTYIDGDGVGKSLKPSYDRSRDSESKESTYLNSKPMKSSSDPPLKFPKNQTMTPPSRNLLSSIQRPKTLDFFPKQIEMHGGWLTEDASEAMPESPMPLEAWLTLRHRSLRQNGGTISRITEDDCIDQPLAFSIRCPHSQMLIEPSDGFLYHPEETSSDCVPQPNSDNVRVRLTLPAEHARWLRCTALEVELTGGIRKTVPIQVHCTPPSRKLRVEDRAGARDGLYFRGSMINFGEVAVGSVETRKVRLCNGSHTDEAVYIRDPHLPYVLSHHQLTIRKRAYVRLPVRFMPTVRGDFESILTVQWANERNKEGGTCTCQVTLIGTGV